MQTARVSARAQEFTAEPRRWVSRQQLYPDDLRTLFKHRTKHGKQQAGMVCWCIRTSLILTLLVIVLAICIAGQFLPGISAGGNSIVAAIISAFVAFVIACGLIYLSFRAGECHNEICFHYDTCHSVGYDQFEFERIKELHSMFCKLDCVRMLIVFVPKIGEGAKGFVDAVVGQTIQTIYTTAAR